MLRWVFERDIREEKSHDLKKAFCESLLKLKILSLNVAAITSQISFSERLSDRVSNV
jgi:hypothetical protein